MNAAGGSDVSESFALNADQTAYTYNAYNLANCAGAPFLTFINVLVNGTCVASSTPSGLLSITVVAAPATTTTTTINIGAVVGAVLSVFFVAVSAVLFCRYKKVCCFAQPGSNPSAPPVMNPVGIVMK